MSQQKRREISFSNWQEVIADIETLARGKYETTGSHSFGKIVQHLATTNEMVVGNVTPPKLPWFVRLAMPFLKNGLPNKAMQEFFWSQSDVDLEEAIGKFRASVKAYVDKGPLPIHPVFGKATPEQIDRVTLSHAAMHLSFVHSR